MGTRLAALHLGLFEQPQGGFSPTC